MNIRRNISFLELKVLNTIITGTAGTWSQNTWLLKKYRKDIGSRMSCARMRSLLWGSSWIRHMWSWWGLWRPILGWRMGFIVWGLWVTGNLSTNLKPTRTTTAPVPTSPTGSQSGTRPSAAPGTNNRKRENEKTQWESNKKTRRGIMTSLYTFAGDNVPGITSCAPLLKRKAFAGVMCLDIAP